MSFPSDVYSINNEHNLHSDTITNHPQILKFISNDTVDDSRIITSNQNRHRLPQIVDHIYIYENNTISFL